MNKYYFTFMMKDEIHRGCYHVIEAPSYVEARDKMIEAFGIEWAFQYDENDWKVSKESFNRIYSLDPLPSWFEGMTQADLFNLKEI